MTEDELYHYGVKGMKWGVRRFNAKRKASRMSSDELQKNIGDFKGRNTKLKRIANRKEVKIAKHKMAIAKRKAKTFRMEDKEKAKRFIEKNKNLEMKNSKLQTKIAKAEKEMRKNRKIINLLNTKLSDLNRESGVNIEEKTHYPDDE